MFRYCEKGFQNPPKSPFRKGGLVRGIFFRKGGLVRGIFFRKGELVGGKLKIANYIENSMLMGK